MRPAYFCCAFVSEKLPRKTFPFRLAIPLFSRKNPRQVLMPTDAILACTRLYLDVDPTVSITMTPIKKGASGRTIVRVVRAGQAPFIGVHWKPERPDNENFVPVARFLKKCKVNVPEIFYENRNKRVALVEDLGEVDLLSLRDQPFAERAPLYRSALEQIDKLFYARTPKDLELMPPFDEGMYRWEQEYFMDHLAGDFLGMDAGPLRRSEELLALAKRMGASAKHLVHRDFQSQNILVHEGQCTKVDPSVPATTAGLLGCGVMAGIGAAINTGNVGRGERSTEGQHDRGRPWPTRADDIAGCQIRQSNQGGLNRGRVCVVRNP